MKPLLICLLALCMPISSFAATENEQLQAEIQRLKKKTQLLINQVNHLSSQVQTHTKLEDKKQSNRALSHSKIIVKNNSPYRSVPVTVHALKDDPSSVEYYPAALIADGHPVTYIAGMPIVTSPYLGARPAFDGSDYIVNISSINRDIRLMQQRRKLFNSFEQMGYAHPNLPVMAISGKVEPIAAIGQPFVGGTTGDLSLGSNELDIAAAVHEAAEAYISISYVSLPSNFVAQRVNNSVLNLNLGFVNIGDLDVTPFYLTAGQIFVPFGRYSSSMISPPLTMIMSRIKSRPVIVGYRSQIQTGPYVALYGYRADTTLSQSAVGGLNAGFLYDTGVMNGELGVSFVSSMNDAGGMQINGSAPNTTFGGFGSVYNGNEHVKKIPAFDIHAILAFNRYSLTAEWVTSVGRFRPQDLSFNDAGAQPQSAQLEAGFTFMTLDKPSSLSASAQWSKDSLAMNLPNYRYNAVYNISIWKDTVESIEYRHDVDFGKNDIANGAAPAGVVNQNTLGTGGSSNTVLLQMGVYF